MALVKNFVSVENAHFLGNIDLPILTIAEPISIGTKEMLGVRVPCIERRQFSIRSDPSIYEDIKEIVNNNLLFDFENNNVVFSSDNIPLYRFQFSNQEKYWNLFCGEATNVGYTYSLASYVTSINDNDISRLEYPREDILMATDFKVGEDVGYYTIARIFVTDEDDNKEYELLGFIGHYYDSRGYNSSEILDAISITKIEEIVGAQLNYNYSDDVYGDFSGTGGYSGGGFNGTSDTVYVPNLPAIGISNLGILNVYNPTSASLAGFIDELFPEYEASPLPDLSGDDIGLSDIAKCLFAIGENLAYTFKTQQNSNLVNFVTSCHIIPVRPTIAGESTIKVGYKTTSNVANVVSNDYVKYDCGTIEVEEYYHNFIDYVGTTAKLYLPFVGFVDVLPEFFQNGRLGIEYIFNVIDGTFTCFVTSTSSKSTLSNSVVQTYSGTCCVSIPISGANYNAMASGIVNGALDVASGIGSMMSGNVLGGISSTLSGSLNALGSKPTVQQSNGYNSSSGFLGIRVPFLLINRQVSDFSKSYTKEKGLPLNVSGSISEYQGLTIATNLLLSEINVLEEERDMIKNMFIEGVYL